MTWNIPLTTNYDDYRDVSITKELKPGEWIAIWTPEKFKLHVPPLGYFYLKEKTKEVKKVQITKKVVQQDEE